MKRIVITLFLAMASVLAMAQTNVWNGGREMWVNGSGSESDPYLIESADHLAFLAYLVNKGFETKGICFKLTVDVDLNGSSNQLWTPIGMGKDVYSEDGCERVSSQPVSTTFQGHFDGDGHTISGLFVETNHYAGLFGFVESQNDSLVRIENVIVSDGYVKGSIAGGIVATGDVHVMGCKNGADIEGETVGGIVGDGSRRCKVRNCMNNGHVKGGMAGGIVGKDPREIIECYNTGEISSDSIICGGISGEIISNCVVKNCYNIGSVSAVIDYAGGLFGVSMISSIATVTHCYNVGLVSCDGTHVDGIGPTSRKYDKCYCLNTSGQSQMGTMMTAEEMRAPSFVDTLSLHNEGVWGQDIYLLNDGFPILFKNYISTPESPMPKPSVFPNPAKDHIIVQGANMKRIQLFDLFGRKVFEKAMNSYDESISIPLKGLPEAVYVLKVVLKDDTVYSHSVLVFEE